jgi:hypothetical protein
MTTAKEYRGYAIECLDSAKTANSDEERNGFLQMAQTWLQAAAQLEGPEMAPTPDLTQGRIPAD